MGILKQWFGGRHLRHPSHRFLTILRSLSWVVAFSFAHFAGLGLQSVYGAPLQKTLRAGAAIADITPPLGVSLNGGMRDRTATFIHDPLSARCVVLDDGSSTLALVICDSCLIPREIVLDAKAEIEAEIGIPQDHVLIAATHAHSCPTCTPAFQSEVVPGYPEFLASKIAEGVQEAHDRLEGAEIGWDVGSNDKHVFNRRWFMKPGTVPAGPFIGKTDGVKMNPPAGSPNLVEPAGPIDPSLPVVMIRGLHGDPIALVANFALHYVGGTGAGHVSADYFGAFARQVTEKLKLQEAQPPFVALMSNGASGDINNINFRERRISQEPYEQIETVAEDVANEAIRVLEAIEFQPSVTLDARTIDLELGVRRPTESEVLEAESIIDAANGPVMQSLQEIYARETVLLADYPPTVPVTVQAIRIGELAIVAAPCEVFVEIGLKLKEESPFPTTILIELANGYNGYLPTRHHHELGGYETWRARSSYLEVSAAEKMTNALLDLLRELRAED